MMGGFRLNVDIKPNMRSVIMPTVVTFSVVVPIVLASHLSGRLTTGRLNLQVLNKTRFTDVTEDKLKTILMWNDAYGVRTYDIGHGREPFYKYKCPDTR
jgi:hypothetical protein